MCAIIDIEAIMKNLIVVTMFLTILASGLSAQATGYVESYHDFNGGSYSPAVNVWIQGPVKDKVGYFVWSLNSKEYAEAYAGLNYKLTNWMEVGAGVGLETAKSPARVGLYTFISKGRFSSFAGYENGGSGYWDRVTTNYTLYKNDFLSIGAGGMHQSFKGYGPRVQIGLGKRITVWTSFLAEKGKPTSMLAVQWGF